MMCILATLKFSLNFIGLISSGSGAFLLAYHVFSFKGKFPGNTWIGGEEKEEHEEKNQNLIKVAMILIPLGAVFQLLALLIDQ